MPYFHITVAITLASAPLITRGNDLIADTATLAEIRNGINRMKGTIYRGIFEEKKESQGILQKSKKLHRLFLCF